MIYFTAHTFKCVCHCRRAMFRVLGMYNFGVAAKLKEPPSIFFQFVKIFLHIYLIIAIQTKHTDWKDFLVKRLTGARTLPSNFYCKVMESVSSIFRIGMNFQYRFKK